MRQRRRRGGGGKNHLPPSPSPLYPVIALTVHWGWSAKWGMLMFALEPERKRDRERKPSKSKSRSRIIFLPSLPPSLLNRASIWSRFLFERSGLFLTFFSNLQTGTERDLWPAPLDKMTAWIFAPLLMDFLGFWGGKFWEKLYRGLSGGHDLNDGWHKQLRNEGEKIR